MTRRRVAALAFLLALAPAAPSAAQHDGAGSGPTASPSAAQHVGAGSGPTASLGFDAVTPAQLDVVAGESVTWTNDSSRVHTVTADDGSFDSGRMGSSQRFAHHFAATGAVAYHCTLHPLIRGVVDVHALLLDAPSQAAAPQRPFVLTGRAALPAGAAVTLERDDGGGFLPLASAPVGDAGAFAMRIVPTATASYRVVAGAAASRPVTLLVLDHRVALTVRRLPGGRTRLRATVTPAARAGRIVLQLLLPERFGWWPVRSARPGGDSAATFTVRTRRRLRARVRYTLADGATALATSRTVRVGRPALGTSRTVRVGRPALGRRR